MKLATFLLLGTLACGAPAPARPEPSAPLSVAPTPTAEVTPTPDPGPTHIPGLALTPFLEELEGDGFECFMPSRQPTEPDQHIWECNQVDHVGLHTLTIVDQDRKQILLFIATVLLFGKEADSLDAWISLRGLCCSYPFRASGDETQPMWVAAQEWFDKNRTHGSVTTTHGLALEVEEGRLEGGTPRYVAIVAAAGRAP